MKLQILTPDKIVAAEENADEITIPAHWGQMGILNGYTDFITTLQKGTIIYKAGGVEKSHEVTTGGLFVIKNNDATILVDQ